MCGEVQEWLNWLVSKTSVQQCTEVRNACGISQGSQLLQTGFAKMLQRARRRWVEIP